jgi:predicted dehydrogenase
MKVALIGIGRWGQVLLKELKAQTEVKYECDRETDLEPVLSDPEIEAVFIAVPTEDHFAVASRALESGKHVFLEKPGTTSSADLEKLVELARDKKVKFALGYEFPHGPAAQRLKELLKGERIKNLFFEWHKWGTFKDHPVPHFLSHEISIAQFLGLKLEPVANKKIQVISETDILGVAFQDGSSVMINRVSPVKSKTLTVITENGGYIWENDELFEISKESQELKKIELPAFTPVAAEIKDFLSAIADDREPLINGQFALEVYKTIEQV